MSKALDELKNKLKFESVNPQINKTLKSWLDRPDDCFGRRYDPADQEYCGDCIVMTDVEGRREPLWVFCKEFCEQNEETPAAPLPELKEVAQEIQAQKEEKTKTKTQDKPEVKPNEEPWKAKMVDLIGTVGNKELIETIAAEFNLEPKRVRFTLAGYLSAQKRKSAQ
jgi:hypothetical protein